MKKYTEQYIFNGTSKWIRQQQMPHQKSACVYVGRGCCWWWCFFCGLRARSCGHSGGRRRWEEFREQPGNIYITMRKTDSQWAFAAWCRDLPLELWDNPKGWDGEGGGSGVREGGDPCTPEAGSCWRYGRDSHNTAKQFSCNKKLKLREIGLYLF